MRNKFKSWTTAKLKEVIDDPYNRGTTGTDYQDSIEEIIDEYYSRLTKNNEKETNKMIKQYNSDKIPPVIQNDPVNLTKDIEKAVLKRHSIIKLALLQSRNTFEARVKKLMDSKTPIESKTQILKILIAKNEDVLNLLNFIQDN